MMPKISHQVGGFENAKSDSSAADDRQLHRTRQPAAEAVGTRYPFCIQGDEQPGLSGCTFTSYEQCQASASGRRLWCIANPYYAGDGDAPPYAGRGRRLPPAYPGYPRY